MFKQNFNTQSSSSSLITMTILGVIITIIVIATYINGDQLQSRQLSRSELSLTSKLANKYSLSPSGYDNEEKRVRIHMDLQKIYPTQNPEDTNAQEQTNTIEEYLKSDSANSKNTSMVHILEYEKLKTFIRQLSMSTIKKLRKLITINPDEGKRYLIELVQNGKLGRRSGLVNDNVHANANAIDHKDFIKIATVIFEPEFLDLPDFDKFDMGETGSVYNRSLPSETKNSINYYQHQPEFIPHESPQQIDQNHYSGLLANSQPQLRKPMQNNIRNIHNFKPSKLESSNNLYQVSYGLPTAPSYFLTSPAPFSIKSTPSLPLNYQNYVQSVTFDHENPIYSPKPVVEFIQVVDPTKLRMRNKNKKPPGLHTDDFRHPISFHISSILEADTRKQQQLLQPNVQAFYDNVYQNPWISSENDNNYQLEQFTNTNAEQTLILHNDPLEYSSTVTSSYAIPNIRNLQSLRGQAFEEVTHHEFPVIPGFGFVHTKGSSVQSNDNLENSKGGAVIGQSPNNNRYKQYQNSPSSNPGYFNNGYVNYNPQLGIYENAQQNLQTPQNNQAFDYSGNGHLVVKNEHDENSYVSNLKNWMNSATSVFDEIGTEWYSTSASTRKILEMSISGLAFLAFGTYIATLLLRTLIPVAIFPGVSLGRNRTDMLGILFGRSSGSDGFGENNQAIFDLKNSENDSSFLNELEQRIKVDIAKFIKDVHAGSTLYFPRVNINGTNWLSISAE